MSELETALQSRLLLEAPKQISDLRLFRRQIMAGRIEGRFMRAGIKGQADLYGFFKGGIDIELELKAERGEAGKRQIAWREFCLAWGIMHLQPRALRGEEQETTVARWIEEIRRARAAWRLRERHELRADARRDLHPHLAVRFQNLAERRLVLADALGDGAER